MTHDEHMATEMPAKKALRSKGLRERLKVPGSVVRLAVGPPELQLEQRAEALRSLRASLHSVGLTQPEVIGRWPKYAVATGQEALTLITSDEEQADARGHWWTRDVHWIGNGGDSHLLVLHDPDGHDLVLIGWGANARHVVDAAGASLPLG
jgi:hypothetical protein